MYEKIVLKYKQRKGRVNDPSVGRSFWPSIFVIVRSNDSTVGGQKGAKVGGVVRGIVEMSMGLHSKGESTQNPWTSLCKEDGHYGNPSFSSIIEEVTAFWTSCVPILANHLYFTILMSTMVQQKSD